MKPDYSAAILEQRLQKCEEVSGFFSLKGGDFSLDTFEKTLLPAILAHCKHGWSEWHPCYTASIPELSTPGLYMVGKKLELELEPEQMRNVNHLPGIHYQTLVYRKLYKQA